MKIAFSLIATLALAPAALLAEPEISGSPQDVEAYLAGKSQTVLLSGEAKVQVPVERAIATVKVVSEGRTLADAIQQNREQRGRVTAQLQKAGFAGGDITGSRFSSSPNYGLFGEKAKSYRIENIVQVTVSDDQQFQALAGVVDRFPDVHFQGIEPQPGDVEQHQLAALRKAMEHAQKRREAVEMTLGIRLQARGIQMQDVSLPRPQPLYRAGGSPSYAGKLATPSSSLADARATIAPDGVELGGLGEITVTAQVTVIYSATAK